MSSSKIISDDKGAEFSRWELPSVQKAGRKSRVDDVSAQAGQVKPLTAQQLEEIQKAAHQEGYEAGHKEGLAAGQKEIRAAAQRLGQIIHAFSEPLEDVDARVEQELVALALAISRQIIRRELKTDPGQVIAVVREALAALPAASRRVTVTLHPEDAALVRESLLTAAGEEASWRIVEDPLLTRGGCRIQAEHSQVDASVEHRIAAIVAQLIGGERRDDSDSESGTAR